MKIFPKSANVSTESVRSHRRYRLIFVRASATPRIKAKPGVVYARFQYVRSAIRVAKLECTWKRVRRREEEEEEKEVEEEDVAGDGGRGEVLPRACEGGKGRRGSRRTVSSYYTFFSRGKAGWLRETPSPPSPPPPPSPPVPFF